MKENVGSIPRGKVHVLLCLEVKVQKMTLAEVQD